MWRYKRYMRGPLRFFCWFYRGLTNFTRQVYYPTVYILRVWGNIFCIVATEAPFLKHCLCFVTNPSQQQEKKTLLKCPSNELAMLHRNHLPFKLRTWSHCNHKKWLWQQTLWPAKHLLQFSYWRLTEKWEEPHNLQHSK